MEKYNQAADEASATKAQIDHPQETYADAVKNGHIPAQASPYFVKTYKELQGDNVGRSISVGIETDYANWDGKNNNDPAAFQNWYADEVKNKLGNVTDPLVLKSAYGHIAALQSKLSQQYVTDVDTSMKVGANNTASNTVTQIVDDAVKGIGPDGHLDTAPIASQIDDMTAKLKANGLRGDQLNKMVIDATVERAKTLKNADILTALTRDRADGTPGPGMTAYGRTAIDAAHQEILQRQDTATNHAWTNMKRNQELLGQSARRDAVSQLYKNPQAELPQQLIQAGTLADPDFATKVEDLRQKIITRGAAEDPPGGRRLPRQHPQCDGPSEAAGDRDLCRSHQEP